ncbi:MAG: shikimate dehydrogenase family protein [Paludibacteraceae bacterium]
MKHFGIIGFPLAHSFSARYFTEKFLREHIDAEYSLYPIRADQLPKHAYDRQSPMIQLLSTLDGMNVTLPYKETIIPYLNHLDDTAQAIGAVNVVHNRIGYNTDCLGFIYSIRPLLLPTDKRALVLGTGGAAKAVIYGLHKLGLETTSVSRTLRNGMLGYEQLNEDILHTHTVVVNCTPLGMYPDTDSCPSIPYHLLTPAHLLFDCVYNPAETLFLKQGRLRQTRTQNGLGMLYGQAEEAWKIWNTTK